MVTGRMFMALSFACFSSELSVLSIASVLIPEEDVHPTVCWERGE